MSGGAGELDAAGDPGDLGAWLGPRLDGAPPELAEAVRALIAEARVDTSRPGPGPDAAGAIAERLAAAALRGLDGVLAGPAQDRSARRTALRLLAADAALTYAFEAAADLGLDAGRLADRLGPRGALGARLREGEPS